MPSVACRYVGAVKSTLTVWSQEGCPLLGGRRLRTKLFHAYGNRSVRCYSKSDLDELLRAKARLPSPTTYQDSDWATLTQAARIAGCDRRYFRHILPNTGIAKRTESAVLGNGKIVEIVVVSRKDLQAFLDKRGVVPDDRMTIRQAAKKLGLLPRTVYAWIPSCPHLKDRSLDAVAMSINYKGQIRLMVLLSRVEVEEIAKMLRHGPKEPLTDAQGTWHPLDRALRFKNARKGLLYLHKNKPCPQLGGDILHAKRFRRMVSTTYRKSIVWAWLEADLKRLTPAQPGGRPNRAVLNGSSMPDPSSPSEKGPTADGNQPHAAKDKGKQVDSTGNRTGAATSSRSPTAAHASSAVNHLTEDLRSAVRRVPYKGAKIAAILRAFHQKLREGCNIKEAAHQIAQARGESYASVQRTIYRYRSQESPDPLETE
jgi:hypothetical protein